MGIRDFFPWLFPKQEVFIYEPLAYDTTQTFDFDTGEWGDGWIEITALGDEVRRFQKPDGKIVELPFGEHTDEEDE